MSNFYKFLCDVVSPALRRLAEQHVPLRDATVHFSVVNGCVFVDAETSVWTCFYVGGALYERKAA